MCDRQAEFLSEEHLLATADSKMARLTSCLYRWRNDCCVAVTVASADVSSVLATSAPIIRIAELMKVVNDTKHLQL